MREAALGVAGLVPEDLEAESLSLPLGISVWLARSDIGADHACDALGRLRAALLEVSGLDRCSEPVPLVGGDRRHSIVTQTVYLHGLVERGARATSRPRRVLAEEALALLEV